MCDSTYARYANTPSAIVIRYLIPIVIKYILIQNNTNNVKLSKRCNIYTYIYIVKYDDSLPLTSWNTV